MGTEPTQAQVAALRQQHTGRLFWKAHRAFGELAFEKLHERGYAGLSTVHTNLLANLDIDGTNVTTLADRAGITKQAMGRLASELEGAGYIRVKSDPKDARVRVLLLTGTGRQLMLDSLEVMAELERRYEGSVGRDRVAAILRGLAAFVEQAEQGESR